MKKKSKQLKVIDFLNFGIFPGIVLFSCGNSYEEIISTINKEYKSRRWHQEGGYNLWSKGIESEKDFINAGSCFALKRELTNSKEGLEKTLYYIIITKQFEFTDYDMCSLAHEVLHICQFHLPDILNRDREYEAEAYTHTHLMGQCLKILRGK